MAGAYRLRPTNHRKLFISMFTARPPVVHRKGINQENVVPNGDGHERAFREQFCHEYPVRGTVYRAARKANGEVRILIFQVEVKAEPTVAGISPHRHEVEQTDAPSKRSSNAVQLTRDGNAASHATSIS